MTNANNYTDNFDAYSIKKNSPISAQGMVGALNTKEKVSNKQTHSTDAAGTLTASSSDSYYPTSKLLGANLDTLRTTLSGKEDAANREATMTNSSAKYPSSAAVLAALGGKENSSNKVTAISSADKDSSTSFPTIGAITAYLAEFLLPAGTIIAMQTKAYYNGSAAAFRAKWKICDGTGGAPDLRNLFLRGTADGGTAAAGSDSVTLTAANLPNHEHSFKGNTATGNIKGIARGWLTTINGDGVFSGTHFVENTASQMNNTEDNGGSTIKFSMTPSGSVTGGGGSPQTAVSIVPKYFAVIYVMKVS